MLGSTTSSLATFTDYAAEVADAAKWGGYAAIGFFLVRYPDRGSRALAPRGGRPAPPDDDPPAHREDLL